MKRRQFLAAGFAAALPLPAMAVSDRPPVHLANELWSVEIDPATLAIQVQPTSQPPVELSRGVATATVSGLTTTLSDAAWTRDGTHISARLDGPDLHLTLTATQPTTLDLLDQPAAAVGRGLILPLGEGAYAPAGNAAWRDYLSGPKSELDTSEGLALPLWGVDHGAFTLHWLLTHPFNNTLVFSAEGDGTSLKVSHEFTTLAPQTPMTLILHLAGNDRLAGARRYRRHRLETNTWEPLAAKIAAAPDTEKLIGASHIYLWGNDLLAAKDIRSLPALFEILRGPAPLAAALRAEFEPEAAELLANPKPMQFAYGKSVFTAAVNAALTNLARRRWQTDSADAPTLVAAYADLRRQAIALFGPALTPDPATWGEGLSRHTFTTLKQAGLDRLWIGLGDGWEGGLWRPEAVRDAVTAGYLIGPYDAYGGAIKPGVRPDWATSQLGKTAFETCGIIRKDGTVQPGFMQAGVYVNTACTRPIMEERITAVAKATGYNSWFLDVTASGLVFDDYRTGHETTMAQYAEANAQASRWVSQTMKLPLGSEDGKATTVGGVTFAHGMESPVIWGDPDMQKNKDSPYYLGNWFPSTQPSVFFKTVPIKDPYHTVWYAHEHRLPLYQAAFHGSVITTHHWWFDNLKLSHVRAERELTQLLHNVPPLYHLSAGTLTERLPVIVKQDAFFRPVHQALYDKTLEAFAWLSDDGHVQMTTFSDGSRLVANYAADTRQAEGHDLPPHSITALLPGQPPRIYQA